MRNIGRIFLDDLRAVGNSVVSVVVALSLCLAPGLCAWVGIASSWNPYGNIDQLKVAVANSDDGYESSLMPARLNIGDRVVGALRKSENYNWVFVDERAAIDGVRSGEYYAAITLPRDFSSKMISVLSSEAEKADVGFYLNPKESPSAPVLAGKDGAEVDEDIRARFTEAVDDMSLELATDLVSFAGGSNARDFGARLVAHLNTTVEDIDALAERLRSYAEIIGASTSLVSVASDTLVDSQNMAKASGAEVERASEALNAAIESAQSAANDINQQVKDAKDAGGLSGVGTSAASDLAHDVATLASSIESISKESDAASSALEEAAKNLSTSSDSAAVNLDTARNQLSIAANKLSASSAKIRKFQDDVASAIATGDLSEVATVLGGGQVSLAHWLAEPVQIVEKTTYAASDYGSSVMPLHLVVALWLGAVLLVLLVKAELSPERLSRYEEMRGRPVGYYEQYLGRSLVFALLSLIQATIAGLGVLFFLHVPCSNPLLFMVACWVCSLAFGSIVYLLAVSFGGIGTAIGLLLLAVQIAVAFSAYPAQMMGDVFQCMTPFLPFTHGMHALRASMIGPYATEYAFDLLYLAVFLVASLVLGLALRRPLIRASAFFNSKVQDTGLM